MSSHLLGAAALSIYTRWFIMKNECQRCHWNYTWRGGGGVRGRGEGVGIEITDNITYDIRKRFPLPRLFVLAAARFHYWVRWRSWRGQNFCLRLLWIYWPTDQCPQYQWLLWWCGKLTRMTKMKEAVISQKLLKKTFNRTRIYSYLFNIPTNCLRAKRVTIANRHCTQSTYMTSWAQLCMPLDRIENISPVLTLSSLVGYISYVMSWVSKIILVAPIFFLYAPAICPQNLTC